MYEPDPSPPSEGAERARRRGIFSRTSPPFSGAASTEAEAAISAYQQLVMDRLEEGLRAIQQTARSLMHEIATEIWRASGGSKDETRANILEALTRDQAIRSLVAHSDERFQDLAVRTARLEEALTSLAEDSRTARQALADSVEALESLMGAPAVRGYEELRGDLQEVTRKVASAFEALADRDRIMVETVQQKVKDHGELIALETRRVAKAMEGYVQEGVNALGMLAGRVDAQVEALASRDDDIALRIEGTVEEHMRLLGQQLQLMHDRIGIEGRDIVGTTEAAIRATQEVNRTLESRVMGLAQLVRSDSEALRGELVRTAAAADERIARTIDEQLGRVSEALTTATRWTVEEMTRRLREETTRTIQSEFDEAMIRLGRPSAEARRAEEDQLAQVFDARISALARMVRSDNEALAAKVQAATDQDAAKQALRAVKEMQANLPTEVQEIVDQRVQAIADQLHRDVQTSAESVAQLGEVLGQKVEEMSSRIGKRHDEDIKVVIDRMGDAMHALASLGRNDPDRIELE